VKVVVAMSGGVDSSVAAALLKDEGYEVIGVTMQIWPPEGNKFGGCCGVAAIEDARKVAHTLGIPYYVMNLRDVFSEKVINNFIDEYQRGRTPNPCVRCNQHIKFGALLEKARGLGADFVATGHHARVEKEKDRYLLKKGLDANKDQSYFLYSLAQEQLAHSLMPIGKLTKEEVREIARKLKLPVAAKPQSTEICFIPDDDYCGFITDYIPDAARPGPILDESGKVLGSHQGIIHHTIGQRKGLVLAAAEPLYVIAIDPAQNAIIVGSREKAFRDELTASDLNWITSDTPVFPFSTHAKIRYRHPEAPATVTPYLSLRDHPDAVGRRSNLNRLSPLSSPGVTKVHVKYTHPQMAITPGQAVVFYDGDVVVGGGTIER